MAYSAIARTLPMPRVVVTVTSLPHRSPMRRFCACRTLMEPRQPRRPRAQIERERKAADDHFGFAEQPVALGARCPRRPTRGRESRPA